MRISVAFPFLLAAVASTGTRVPAQVETAPERQGATERAAPIQPTARPFLWRIAVEPPSWLYGTIHIGDRRVTALPEVVRKALAASEVLVTEIELDPKTQAAAQQASLLPDGKTLGDVLPADLHRRLQAYLERREFPAENVARMRPWVVMTLLPLVDDWKTVMSEKALDAVLVQQAKAAGKETAALETLDEQLGVFGAFTDAEQAAMLESTLHMLERAAAEGRKPLAELVQAYLAGDLDALEILLDDLTGLEGNEDLEQRLEKLILFDRNQRMAERVAARLRGPRKRSYFFAIGALHYAGEQGLVALLSRAGFTVERVAGTGTTPAEAKRVPAAVKR